MKSITKLKKIEGKKVLLRTDFNVPVNQDGTISSDEAVRIERSLKTIQFLKKAKAKIIIMSHIGRDGKDSLQPIADYISKKVKITFLKGHIQDFVHEHIEKMKPGDVVMLENLRQDDGEVGNNSSFARGLSRLGDIYVNDAFAVSHRRHASIVGIPKFLPSYSGILLDEEVSYLSKAIKKPKKPFLFILGGAKFETKLPLIKKYLTMADMIFVGGALQNNFLKAEGKEIGTSLVDTKRYNLGSIMRTKKIFLPEDVVVKNSEGTRNCPINEVTKKDMIVDIGSKSIQELTKKIQTAKTILWNGPLGLYEEGFTVSTEAIAKAISKSQGFSVIGGGDTIGTIKKLKLEKKIDFVSTGGGAMLEFLEKGKLPGIDALK
jgi:3-phosphoglycerate kinase